MQPIRLPIPPVSTNQIHRGRRYKSKQARQFESDIATLLAVKCRDIQLPDGELALHIRVGTTRQMDVDNALKLLIDCIARHYGINDRRFTALSIVRVPVKQNEGFITFAIEPFQYADFPQLIVGEPNARHA